MSMAVFEQTRMTDGDQSTPLKYPFQGKDTPFSPPFKSSYTSQIPPSATNAVSRTPVLTPATAAMTPMSEATPNVPDQLCIPTVVDTSTGSSETPYSDRTGARDPSPSGRALFHDDSEIMEPSRNSSRKLSRRSSGPPLLPPKEDSYGGFHRQSNPRQPRKLRSRNLQRHDSFHESEILCNGKGPVRKNRRYHSASSDVSLSDYPNSDNDDDYNIIVETESWSTESPSPNREKRFRRRMRGQKRVESSPDQSGSCFKLPRSMGSTKCLVWLLCLVGLTSVSMIILTNHNINALDQQEHYAVLMKRPSDRVAELPSKNYLRVDNKAASLTKFAQDAAKKKKKKNRPAEEQSQTTETLKDKKQGETQRHREEEKHSHDIHKDDKHHRHEEAKNSHHGHKKDKHPSHDQKHPGKEVNHGHHHHDHHDENKRLYVRAKPGIIGINAIPRVAVPAKIDGVSSKRMFQSVDRDLFALHEVADRPENNRIVILDGSPVKDASPNPRLIEEYPAEFTDNTQLYSILDSSDERVSRSMELRKPHVQGECVPMQEWQTTFHPSCNGMHELDMPRMGDDHIEDDFKLFGMKGFWRNAWKYDSISGHSALGERDTVVLKTLKINHRFEDAYYEHNRIDAVVLERLTASPHVINVFGFCGHSVVTEYADGKRLGELADKKKDEPLARLSIARDIAIGLADVHGIDGDGNATFVHLDINPANVVSVGGTLKLNDFNIGILRRWNTTSNEPCGIPSQYPNPQWRSPEEARNEQNLTEKVDVFSLGHILFRLICGHEPWHKLEPGGMPPKDVLNEKVKQGVLPTIPDEIMNSSDPEIIAIREAMLRCYTYDPTKRPSAREIATSLQNALDHLESNVEAE